MPRDRDLEAARRLLRELGNVELLRQTQLPTHKKGRPYDWTDDRLLLPLVFFCRAEERRAVALGQKRPARHALIRRYVSYLWPRIAGKSGIARTLSRKLAKSGMADGGFEALSHDELMARHIRHAAIHMPHVDANGPFSNYDWSLPRQPLPARQDDRSTAQTWIGLRLSSCVALATHRCGLVATASWALAWTPARFVFWTPSWTLALNIIGLPLP
jgi:hypothetical protein